VRSTGNFSAEIFLTEIWQNISEVFFAVELASVLISFGEPLRALPILRAVNCLLPQCAPSQEAAFWSVVGFGLTFADQPSLALRSYLKARAAAERAGEPAGVAAAFHNCGVCFHGLGRKEEARAFLTVAAEVFACSAFPADPRLLNSRRLLAQCGGALRCALPPIWSILEPPLEKAKKGKKKASKKKKNAN